MTRFPASLAVVGWAALSLAAAGCMSQDALTRLGEGFEAQFNQKNEDIDRALQRVGDALSQAADRANERYSQFFDVLASKYEQRRKPALIYFAEDAAAPAVVSEGERPGQIPGAAILPTMEIKSDFLSERTLEHRGLQVLWKLALDGSGVRYADANGDQLYLVTRNHRLYALDLRNGLTQWVHDLGRRPDGPPGFSDQYVVISAGDTIRIIDKTVGKDRWKFDTAIQPSGRPYCTASSFVFPSWTGDVHGFEFGDLYPRWSFRAGDRVFGAPFLQGAFAYAAADNGTFVKYNIIARMSSNDFNLGSRPVGDLLGTRDFVYVGTENYEMVSVRAADGSKSWTHGCAGRVVAGPWLSPAGVLYYAAEDDGLYALTASTGRQRWRLPHGLRPVAAHGEHLFILMDDSTLSRVDSATGKVLWTESIAPFVSVAGTMQSNIFHLISQDGQVFAVVPKK